MSEIELCLELSVTLLFGEKQRERSSSPKQEEAWEGAADRLFSLCLSSPLPVILSHEPCKKDLVFGDVFASHP